MTEIVNLKEWKAGRPQRNVSIELQVVTEGEQHFICLTMDGRETDRWGPYDDITDAMLWAAHAGKVMKEAAVSANNR